MADWSEADEERRRAAGKRSADQLRAELAEQAALTSQDGRTVHVRVIDVPLGLQDGDQRSDGTA